MMMNEMMMNGGGAAAPEGAAARGGAGPSGPHAQESATLVDMPPCPLNGPLAEAAGYRPGQQVSVVPTMVQLRRAFDRLNERYMSEGNIEGSQAITRMFMDMSMFYHARDARRIVHGEACIEQARCEAEAARHARRAAERRAQEAEAAGEDRHRLEATLRKRQRAPFLAELDNDGDFGAQVARFAATIEISYPDVVREVDGLMRHGWRELLHVVCSAHRAQTYLPGTPFHERRVKVVDVQIVCGDFQRGKSTVEALYAIINHAIHQSPEVGDMCCTLLVTQLRAWALALQDTVENKTSRPASVRPSSMEPDARPPRRAAAAAAAAAVEEMDDSETEVEEEEEEEEDAELVDEAHGIALTDLPDLPICRAGAGNSHAEVKKVLQQGGAAVLFRTSAQHENHSNMIAEINDSRGSNEKGYVYTLVIDESDKFFGDGGAMHSKTLLHMCGFDGRPQPNKPVLVACVSATNCGPLYYFARRMHVMNQGMLRARLADIVAFQPPAANTYKSAVQPALQEGTPMEIPKVQAEYVTDEIVDQWWDAFSKPNSVLLDTATCRVNHYVEHNMLEHVNEVEIQMEQRRMAIPEAERPDPVPGVVLYLHGGHTTHQGMIGLQFLNEAHLPESEYMMAKLRRAEHAASDEEFALANDMQQQGANEAAVAEMRRGAEELREEGNDMYGNYNDITDCLEAHYLTALGQYVKRKALRLGHFSERQLQGMLSTPRNGRFNGKSLWSTKNLQLALFILRKFLGSAPIVVVAGAMVRRSMSIVAVDYFRPKISAALDGPQFAGVYEGQPMALAIITHAILTRFANSADGAHTHSRSKTTLTNWDVVHPELDVVRDLVLQDLSAATTAFTAFNAMGEFQQPLAARRAMLGQIRNGTRRPEQGNSIAAFRERLLQKSEQQLGWFDALVEQARACDDLKDDVTDTTHMLALACEMTMWMELPEATRQVFQRHRCPMFQRGAGTQERDLGNLHANLCTIFYAEREPLRFRHAMTTGRRRGGGGGGPLSAVHLMVLQWFLDQGYVADADGNPPQNPPETWSATYAMRARYPHLLDLPGYTQFGVTGTNGCSSGLGFVMKNLVTRDILDKMGVWRVRPEPPAGIGVAPNKPGAKSREVGVYWLKRAITLPPLPAVAQPPAQQ